MSTQTHSFTPAGLHPFSSKITGMSLAKHFKDSKEIVSRNSAILSALDDGYTQREVARYLGLSMVIVSKIFRGVK